jgi:hypothetical protein
MGWLLLGLLSAIVAIGGVFSTNVGLILGGLAGAIVAGAGYFAYQRVVSKWVLLRVYSDRLEFVRGPQKGVLLVVEVKAVHQLHWAQSWFPYQRATTILALESAKGDYQVGRDVAGHEKVAETVLRLLNEYRGRA